MFREAIALLDTDGIEPKQREGSLLEHGWSGMQDEAMLGARGQAHGISDERPKVRDEVGGQMLGNMLVRIT